MNRCCTGLDGSTSGQGNEVSRSKNKLCVASFLFISRNDAEHRLDEKYSGSSFPYSATRISTACSEKPISILTSDHISYFPRKLLKWHQEEVSEGQDENPGERDGAGQRDDGKRGRGITTEIEMARKRKGRKWEGKKRRWRGKTGGNREAEGNGLLHSLLYHSSMSTSLLIDF